MKNAQEWLLSQNSYNDDRSIYDDVRLNQGKAVTISIASGKGGVGKTSVSLKLSKMLADQGYKVLLIDCDTNLSNTALKLGLPINNNFEKLMKSEMTFDECVYKEGKFHLLSACNGSTALFEDSKDHEKFLIDILVKVENKYDYIFLDSPAGLAKETLTLNAYSDHRFIIVTPDKSSITDSYSLLKILNMNYGITENHLIVNKISNKNQYKRIIKTLSETVENFLSCRLQVLGGIQLEKGEVDLFDGLLFDEANISLHKSFTNLLGRFSEQGVCEHYNPQGLLAGTSQIRQEVQPIC
jgi:flagellar biosynthesis protein FlhG